MAATGRPARALVRVRVCMVKLFFLITMMRKSFTYSRKKIKNLKIRG
jgi:hypothetical protein